MISMNAFVCLVEIAKADSITVRQLHQDCLDRGLKTIQAEVDELVKCGLVDKIGKNVAILKLNKANLSKELSELAVRVSNIKKLNKVSKLTTNYPLEFNNRSNKARADKAKADKESFNKLEVCQLSKRVATRLNPAYRAVVDGDAPSRSDRAIEIFAEGLNRLDRPNFFKSMEGLKPDERAKLVRRAARLDASRWRN